MRMEVVLPGLYASAPESLGFGRSLEIRVFLLERAQGKLLLYRSAALRYPRMLGDFEDRGANRLGQLPSRQ
jgi:hypothetical protein